MPTQPESAVSRRVADRRWRWRVVIVAWLTVIGWLTLRSAPEQAARVALLRWNCVLCGEAGVADLLLNVLLFVPLGLAARGLGVSLWRTLAVVVPLTIGIETTQGFFLAGRDASLGDVLSNSAGGVVGWLSYSLLVAVRQPSRIVAWRGVALLIGLTTAIWFATAIGLRPALSDAEPLIGEQLLGSPERGLFPGTVQRLTINRVDLSGDPPAAPVPRRRDTLDVSVNLTRTGGPLAARSAPFVRIVDAVGRPQVTISGRGTDLVAEARLHGSRWLFHTPQWLFRNGLDMPLQQRSQLRLQWTRNQVTLRVGDTGAAVSSRRLSVALGWIFIHPFVSTVSDTAALWSCLWLAWWFSVSGWLGGALGWRVAGLVGTVQLLSLLAAATVTVTPWHGDELAVALGAYLVAATIAHQRALRRSRPNQNGAFAAS